MSLINREKLIEHLNACLAGSDGDTPITDSVIIAIRCYVEKTPEVDAVPVVRCRECKNYNFKYPEAVQPWGVCERSIYHATDADDFCKHGERRMHDGTAT